jgi:hypothetical protein
MAGTKSVAKKKRKRARLQPFDFDLDDAIQSNRHYLASSNNRDLAFHFLSGPDIDWDAHLLAIRSLLRHRKVDNEAFDRGFNEIKEAAKIWRGPSMQLDMEYVDHLHGKIFLDAAHSMAAVGMLAPFLESLFVQAFYGMREFFDLHHMTLNSKRRQRMQHANRWNCHRLPNGKTNLVDGIFDLAAATGLSIHLPIDLRPTLDALYGYRNKNFHLGLEWPEADRKTLPSASSRGIGLAHGLSIQAIMKIPGYSI